MKEARCKRQTSAGKIVEKRNPSALLVGMQTGAATVGNSMEFPQKTKDGNVFWSSDPTAGTIPSESWITNSKEPMYPGVHSRVIYNSQVLETVKVPISKWVDQKKNVVHLIMEYYVAERKKEFLPSVTAWMELDSIMLSEISQEVKSKYPMISPISGT